MATRIIQETGDPNLAVMVLLIRALFPQLDMKAIDYAGTVKRIDDEIVKLATELAE